MTIYEFNALSEQHQVEATWSGIHLDTRTESTCAFLLYALDGFYVEVQYSPQVNKIIRLRPFKKINPLAPYLERVVVNETGVSFNKK